MAGEQTEAKQETAEETNNKAFDAQAESFYAEQDKVREESSTSKTEETDDESKSQEESGADQTKNANLNGEDAESDADKAVQEKLAKIAEILGDDSKAIEAYIKQHGYHKDPAWQKMLAKAKAVEGKPAIDEATQKKLEQMDKVLSNPDFIRMQMKSEGYKDEAIDAKLRELGHKVEDKSDMFGIVLKQLGVDIDKLPEDNKNYVNTYVADMAKVAEIVVKEILSKTLPETLKPLSENVTSIVQRDAASKMMDSIENTIKEEGVLDYEKDILPEIGKFIDANPQATQLDVKKHFELINHRLSIERLKLGKRKEQRDETKTNLRSNKESSKVDLSGLKKTGNFDKDADALLDAMGVQ